MYAENSSCASRMSKKKTVWRGVRSMGREICGLIDLPALVRGKGAWEAAK